jgi:hypothetical protein
MVRSTLRAIALSTFCAKIVMQFSKAEEASRFRDALERISYLLSLHQLRLEDVVAALENLVDGLAPLAPSGQTRLASMMRLSSIHTLSGWLRALAKWVPEPAPPVPDTDRPDAAAEYWRDKLRGARPAPTVAVVVQALARTGLFERLKLPLATMTLRDWSLTFYESIRSASPERPLWLAARALGALGWSSDAIANVNGLFTTDDLLFQRPATVGGVLVAGDAGSLSESWKPSAVCAALVLRPDEWQAQNFALIVKKLDYQDVVVDSTGSPTAPSTKRALKTEIRFLPEWTISFIESFRRETSILVVNEAPPGVAFPESWRLIVKPTSLDDLLPRLTK